MFWEFTNTIHAFIFHVDYVTPANSTLTQSPNLVGLPYDARNPTGRTDIQQPAPGEALDGVNDRMMHAINFRMLPGGVQSTVLNFTVNVSGVNPTTAALYQAGVRWLELRRDAGTGALTINQEATYAPGSGNGTGRDLWMASVAQDGEGNIGLMASATNSTATPLILNPTGIYTGRLASDPPSTLPQGELDALALAIPPVIGGVQTATSNRWGDYSSMFIDPADDCTFWAAFEYVDAPTGGLRLEYANLQFQSKPNLRDPAARHNQRHDYKLRLRPANPGRDSNHAGWLHQTDQCQRHVLDDRFAGDV